MRAVIQRVRNATVVASGGVTGSVDRGLLVYIGVERGDTRADLDFVSAKIPGLRVFEDENGKMNLALENIEKGGEVVGILAISQFTLHGDLRKGRRPSYNGAAPPDVAEALYNELVERWRSAGIRVGTGVFGTHMDVTYTNDGPVTLILDSRTGS